MVIITDDIDLPAVQPKSFQPAVVSPPNKGAGNEVHFSQDTTTPHKSNKATKSNGLSLSLRRVTPDRFKKENDVTDVGSGASFVSRLTGKGSIYTGATPVMRNNGIERQQKMQDEYYRAPKKGEEGYVAEEELDDGELPSLKRNGSTGGSRSNSRSRYGTEDERPLAAGYWNQEDDYDMGDDDDDSRGGGEQGRYAPSSANAAAAAAAAIAAAKAAKAASDGKARIRRVHDGNTVPMDDRETLKVAGFWSQLDDDNTAGVYSEDEDDEDAAQLRTMHHNNNNEDEEMPNDERQWRRSQSPAARRAKGDDDNASIGLDLHKSDFNDSADTPRNNKGGKANNKGGNWNLIEKAACFANENTAAYEEESNDAATEDEGTRTNGRYSETKGRETIENEDDGSDPFGLNCITDALGSICGYSGFVGTDNGKSDSAKKKERAMAIIERDRLRNKERSGDYDTDDDTEAYDEGYPGSATSVSEDAAIELEYLSRDEGDNGQRANNPMSNNTVVAGVAAVGAAGALVAAGALSPTSEKKKKRLTVKSVRNLLGMSKKKDADEQQAQFTPRTLVTTTTRSGNVSTPTSDGAYPNGIDDVEQDNALQEEPANENDTSQDAKNRSIYDDEELQSEAAAWDSNRKNSYLRELAERAKQEYHAKKASENADDPSLSTGALSASMAAAAAAAAIASSGGGGGRDEQDIQRNDTGVPAGAHTLHNVDYNSFNPTEKRKFLRLLNSGVSPQEATNIFVQKEEIPMLEDDEEEEELQERDEEEGEHLVDGAGEYPVARSGFAPDDEGDRSILSSDPPGDVLGGASGEDAELPKDDGEGRQSRSEMGVHDSENSTHGAYKDGAALPLVPAVVRTKSKAKRESDDVDVSMYEGGAEEYAPDDDGLASIGNSYYDSLRASDEKEDTDGAFLLGKDDTTTRGGTKKSKRHLVPIVTTGLVATGLAAKVAASRRASHESPRNGVYSPVNVSSAVSSGRSNRGHRAIPIKDGDETKFDFSAKSPKAMALNLMNRNSKWSKIGSTDVDDLDGIVSRSVEVEEEEFYSLSSAPDNAKEAERGVSLPSLLPEASATERNVVTPTHEMATDDSVLSPDESAAESSRANSLFMSPDTLSPSSTTDIDHLVEEESFDMDRAKSPFRPNEARDVVADTNESAQMPFIPVSPDESGDNGVDNGVDNSSLMEQSQMTTTSTWTVASKSSRRRHKGAASKRLMQAKQAESHVGAKSKGWIESIRDVASARNQTWDPEKGWVDYAEPEVHVGHGDVRQPIGSLHLPSRKVTPIAEELPDNNSERPSSVDFPSQWAKEREVMIKADPSKQILSSVVGGNGNDVSALEDESVFSTEDVTVNTSADLSSLMSNSAAPTRRAAPKHRSALDKRKAAGVQSKPVGWKESMEAATATMNDAPRQTNHEKGWVDDNGVADDVSELTRLTSLERSPDNKLDHHQSPLEPISPSYHLPSVAEEMLGDSNNNDDDEGEISEEDPEDFAPKLTVEHRFNMDKQAEKENLSSPSNEKPPLSKRSLNQWLEKSPKVVARSPDIDSEDAVHSRETSLDVSSDPSPLSKSLFSALDEVDDAATEEVKVIKGKLSDSDKGLFQISHVSDSFQNKSDSQDVVMESFENSGEWMMSSPPKDDASEDGGSVSLRARQWMTSMEEGNKAEPPQSLDPPSSVVSNRTAKKSAVASPGQVPKKKTNVEELISKLEHPDELNVTTEEENDVIFHSTAMGIRLKRGEDGFVRVVSVTEATAGSSIVRDGSIEPDDVVREAAGVNLR